MASPIGYIQQAEFLVLLEMTFQSNGRFTKHIKRKLLEANKCLYVLRSVRKEGYNQVENDHLFQSLVSPKISYGLSVQSPCPNLMPCSCSFADVINAALYKLEKTDTTILS